MTNPADALRTRLRADLASAMAARDMGTAKVLRALVSAIDNAEAVPVDTSGPYREARFGDPSTEVPRKILDEEALRAVIEADAAERTRAAAEYRAIGRADRATELDSEAGLVRRYLTG